MPVFATVLIAALASAAPSPTPLPTLAPAMMKLAMPSFGPSTPAIAVKVNQPFQIRMKASAGTGYSWRPRGPLPPNLALLGAFEQPNGKAMPGAAGTQTLVFRGSSPGKFVLTLEYARPWERNVKPAKVQMFAVTVHK